MNAIPLVNNNFKIEKSMNRINNGSGVAPSSLGAGSASASNEQQLRQEVNTSIVALKREAFSLETLISQAAQELVNLNKRIEALEQGETSYVKKSDVTDTVESGNVNPVSSQGVHSAIGALDVSQVGGSGKYISAISETDGVISAVASDLITMITSSVDLNTIVQAGVYATASDGVGNGCTNIPVSSPATFFLNVVRSENNTTMQIFTDSSLNRYIRNSYNGGQTWNAWRKLITNEIRSTKLKIAHHYGEAYLYRSGNVVFFSLMSDWSDLVAGYTYQLAYIPVGFRPCADVRMRETTVENVCLQISSSNAHVYCYNYGTTFTSAHNGSYNGCWITTDD